MAPNDTKFSSADPLDSKFNHTIIRPSAYVFYLFPLGALPVVIPALAGRVLGLHAAVFDREHVGEDTLFDHRLAEQSATIAGTDAQLLTGRLHGLVLALELEFVGVALLGLEQLPSAVDGPVAEVTVAGEAERTGSQRMVEEVADESWNRC